MNCPDCLGYGYDIIVVAACCGNHNYDACCGEAIPEQQQEPCVRCGGTGEISALEIA